MKKSIQSSNLFQAGHFLKYSELGSLVNILYIGSRNKVTEHKAP